MRIGWIGLGRMGIPMSTRLLEAGYALTAWSRNTQKVQTATHLGAEAAACPREVAERSDVVITMVADKKALFDVTNGENGIIAGLSGGKIFVDMSTVSPAESDAVAASASARGALFLCAPVTGSITLAASGELVVLASGSREAYETAMPVFETLSRKSYYLGPKCEARTMKLSLNLMVAVTMQMQAEAVLLAEKTGLEPSVICDLISDSAVGSPLCKYKAETISGGEYEPAFSVKLMKKDMSLILDEGKIHDLTLPAAELTNRYLCIAEERGYGDLDFSVLTKVNEELNNFLRP